MPTSWRRKRARSAPPPNLGRARALGRLRRCPGPGRRRSRTEAHSRRCGQAGVARLLAPLRSWARPGCCRGVRRWAAFLDRRHRKFLDQRQANEGSGSCLCMISATCSLIPHRPPVRAPSCSRGLNGSVHFGPARAAACQVHVLSVPSPARPPGSRIQCTPSIGQIAKQQATACQAWARPQCSAARGPCSAAAAAGAVLDRTDRSALRCGAAPRLPLVPGPNPVALTGFLNAYSTNHAALRLWRAQTPPRQPAARTYRRRYGRGSLLLRS